MANKQAQLVRDALLIVKVELDAQRATAGELRALDNEAAAARHDEIMGILNSISSHVSPLVQRVENTERDIRALQDARILRPVNGKGSHA